MAKIPFPSPRYQRVKDLLKKLQLWCLKGLQIDSVNCKSDLAWHKKWFKTYPIGISTYLDACHILRDKTQGMSYFPQKPLPHVICHARSDSKFTENSRALKFDLFEMKKNRKGDIQKWHWIFGYLGRLTKIGHHMVK